MGRHVICPTTEIKMGERKLVTLERRSIGIFNVKGKYYAIRNQCPHQGAPLCKGTVEGMMIRSTPGEYKYGRDGEILRCPWHGWEFDIVNGKSIFDPSECYVRTYDVEIEDGGKEASLEADKGEPVETYPVTVESGVIVVHV